MENTQKEINEKLVSAAYSNDLEKIKELLTSPNLKLHAQINADSRFIANICSNRDLNTLRYVLTSPDLKEHANIHLSSERALSCAVYEGDIPMIKYLLTSPELKDHANFHFEDKNGNNIVVQYIFKVSSFEKSEQLVDYFTLDYAVEKKDIEVYKKLFKNSDDSDYEYQIANNIMINLVNEKDKVHQQELIDFIKEIEPQKYEKFMLKNSLEEGLSTSENTVSAKMKV